MPDTGIEPGDPIPGSPHPEAPEGAPGRGKQQSQRRTAMGWPAAAIAIAFGLCYAYMLFLALSNLIGLSTGLSDPALVPWVPLVIGVLAPPGIFVAAFLIGRRRNAALLALVLATGLTVVFALSLSLEAYVATLLKL